MQNISSVKGKLLYFARHLAATKQLTPFELGILKDLIIADNPEIAAAYQNYVKSGTELTLGSELIQMVHFEKMAHLEKDNSTNSGNSVSSRKNKRNAISIIIPKRMLQKLPAEMERN